MPVRSWPWCPRCNGDDRPRILGEERPHAVYTIDLPAHRQRESSGQPRPGWQNRTAGTPDRSHEPVRIYP
jgi:hypothetical protein